MTLNATAEEERALNNLTEELNNIGKNEINLKVEIKGEFIKYKGENYVSPGSNYDIILINEDTGEKIDGSNIELNCTGGGNSIIKDGKLIVSDNTKFGEEITIIAKYNGQEIKHSMKTLQRITMGTITNSTRYGTSKNCDLFKINSYSTNNKVNAGMLPGESGYTMIALNGKTTQTVYDKDNIRVIKLAVSQGNSSTNADWLYSINPLPIDITDENYIESIESAGYAEMNAELDILINEQNIKIPGLKMSNTIIKKSGEVFSEKQNFDYNEGVWTTASRKINANTELGDILIIEYSLPAWEELTEEEINSIFSIMQNDEPYLATLTLTLNEYSELPE